MMPDRVVREAILTSERVDKLDAEAEVFYRRLLSVADNNGKFDANLIALRSKLYPLRPEMELIAIETSLMICITADLIQVDKNGKGTVLRTKKTARGVSYDAENHPIPVELDTDEFREAWREWCEYRLSGKKPMTEHGCKAAIPRLLSMGVERACKALRYSRAQGYQGIFEERGADGGTSGRGNGSWGTQKGGATRIRRYTDTDDSDEN